MEKTLWKNLQAILFRYRWKFLIAFAMVLTANVLLVLIPLVFRVALENLFNQEAAAGVSTVPASAYIAIDLPIWLWTLLLVSLALIAAFLKYSMRYAFISISRDAEKEVRSTLFAKIQEQSMAFYDKHGIGELLSRLTNDISAYRDVLGPGIMYPVFFTTLVIPGIAALFYISPSLAMLSLVPLVAIPLLNFLTRKPIYEASYAAQKGLADLSNMAQEHYTGIRIIKGYVAEPQLSDIFSVLGKSLIGINIKLNCFQGLLYPLFTLITKMITAGLAMYAGIIILKGWSTLSAADFVSFMWIQSLIFFPVLMLAWVLPIYARGRASYERLVEIYDEPVEVKDGLVTVSRIPADEAITISHLTFRYPDTQREILKDISLKIQPGTFVGITGPVGAGKSTLLHLLNREYEIPRGMIAIGNNDIHDYPLEAFSEEIVTVEQIPFLFSRSIADNVRFGRESAPIEDIEMVARYADLHETVLEFPEQYETVIGERGVTLSGGQKQRVAIARAFLVDRSILLLDDVFSSVDAKTEGRIFSSMMETFKNKTVLLVTHRLSVLEKMDRVIMLENGKVVEDGSPDALKTRNGKFAALAALQSNNI